VKIAKIRMKQILFLSLGLLPLASIFGAEKSFEGTVTMTETRDGAATQFLFTRKGDQSRIDKTDKSKPEPINIIDLAAQKLTIVYPHNSSFAVVDLTKAQNQTPPGAPNLPPSLGSGVPGSSGFATPPGLVQLPNNSAPGADMHVGPQISPPAGFPTPPPMPPIPSGRMPAGPNQMPQMPNNPMPPPQGFGSQGMPPMGGFGSAPELKKTDKTKKIQGFDCTLYTLSDHGETFEIWATPDAALFPIRLARANYQNRHFGPVMLEQQWIELLRNQSLFPLEATLRTDLSDAPAGPPGAGRQNSVPEAGHSQERYSFKVDKIEKKKIANPEELFSPPKDYYEIQGH
jgi:hypothetical protein